MAKTKASHSQQEYYYKGIYPVEIVQDASGSAGHQELEVRAKCRFLHTSNYSKEKYWVNAGEILKVPLRLVWSRRRNIPSGRLQ
jgi:hypothetical protein